MTGVMLVTTIKLMIIIIIIIIIKIIRIITIIVSNNDNAQQPKIAPWGQILMKPHEISGEYPK